MFGQGKDTRNGVICLQGGLVNEFVPRDLSRNYEERGK